MPYESTDVGASVGPVESEVDARWAMSYAAGIGDMLPCYIDTRIDGGIIAHPVFPVCIEWPLALRIRSKSGPALTRAEALRGVHAVQHMILHRPIRPPEKLFTTATIAGVERRKPGAFNVVRFDTVTADGKPVCTTFTGGISRGVDVLGPDRPANMPQVPALAELPARARREFSVPIGANAAHVYTECARIWNPIHTDAAVAAAAGLPKIILHGTATLAIAVSRVIEAEAGNDPTSIAEIYGRFSAMVPMPSEITVRILARERPGGRDAVFFDVIGADDARVIRDGVVIVRN
jgi:acyl dehydratase